MGNTGKGKGLCEIKQTNTGYLYREVSLTSGQERQ
jgi:hypothetical protein